MSVYHLRDEETEVHGLNYLSFIELKPKLSPCLICMGVCVGTGMHAYARGEQGTSCSLYCASPYSLEAESFTELRACCLLTNWQRASVNPLVAGSGAIAGF